MYLLKLQIYEFANEAMYKEGSNAEWDLADAERKIAYFVIYIKI